MAAPKKKKKVDPIKERERRAKIAALCGVLLLAAVAAYEVPKTMKMMKHSAPPPPPPSSVSTSGAGSSLPNITGGATGATPSAGQLVDSDVMPSPAAGQLVSFSVFQTKNPFTPQVSDNTSPTSSSSSSTTTTVPQTSTTPATTTPTTTTTTTPTTTSPASVVPSTPGRSTTTTSQATLAISVNHVVSHVAREETFPTGAPVFRLVSWTKDTAQVGIVGGSYATGDQTLTLHVGRAVTLENQTDGKRYRLELLSTP